MKKLFALIISAIICISFVTPAFADMEGPYFVEYKAVMTKEDGISEEDFDGNLHTIPAGATVTVTGEYENYNTGMKYAGVLYEDHHFDVPMRYIKNTRDEVGTDAAVRLSESVSFRVINPDGAPIRKGPAESYDEIAKIPVDTVIRPEYGTVPDVYELPWAYIEYDGVSGWTEVFQFGECLEYAILAKEDAYQTGEIMILSDNIRLKDTLAHVMEWESKTNYVTGKIPVGTVLRYEYYYRLPKSIVIFTEYNGVKGWVETDESYNGFGNQSAAVGSCNDIMAINEDGFEIYTEPFGSGEATGVTVPANELLKSDMRSYRTVYKSNGKVVDFDSFNDNDYPDDELLEYENTYRVEYKGTKGWITCRGFYSENILTSWDMGSFYTVGDVELKSRYDSDETVAVIPAGETIKPIFNYYGDHDEMYYCEYDGKYGWFNSEKEDTAREQNNVYTYTEDIEIYSGPKNSGELLGTIPAGEEYGVLYSMGYPVEGAEDTYNSAEMVEYNGVRGWIDMSDGAEPTFVRDLIVEPEAPEDATPAETGEATPTDGKSAVRSMTAVYIAVAAAVALAALVTIILIAKKKKSK